MELTSERLNELLSYDPDTGHFVWKVNRKGRGARVGKRAGDLHRNGYRRIRVDGVRYKEHRLIWFYTHGTWPKGDIDHINGVSDDNRITNLRDVPHRTNCENVRRAKSHNKSGLLGVAYYPERTSPKKYRARVVRHGEAHTLGYYETAEEAHAAYVQAKRTLHEGNTL